MLLSVRAEGIFAFNGVVLLLGCADGMGYVLASFFNVGLRVWVCTAVQKARIVQPCLQETFKKNIFCELGHDKLTSWGVGILSFAR